MSQDESKSVGRVGRPKKKQVAANKKGSRGQVGRPKGDAAIINEYKARMLASPKSRKVMDAIFEAAEVEPGRRITIERIIVHGMKFTRFLTQVEDSSCRQGVIIEQDVRS